MSSGTALTRRFRTFSLPLLSLPHHHGLTSSSYSDHVMPFGEEVALDEVTSDGDDEELEAIDEEAERAVPLVDFSAAMAQLNTAASETPHPDDESEQPPSADLAHTAGTTPVSEAKDVNAMEEKDLTLGKEGETVHVIGGHLSGLMRHQMQQPCASPSSSSSSFSLAFPSPPRHASMSCSTRICGADGADDALLDVTARHDQCRHLCLHCALVFHPCQRHLAS